MITPEVLDSCCIVFIGEAETVWNSLQSLLEKLCRERKQVGFSSILDLGCLMGVRFFADVILSCLKEKKVESCIKELCDLLTVFLEEEEEKKPGL